MGMEKQMNRESERKKERKKPKNKEVGSKKTRNQEKQK